MEKALKQLQYEDYELWWDQCASTTDGIYFDSIDNPVPFRESHGRGHFLYTSLAPYITACYEDFTVSLRLLILIKIDNIFAFLPLLPPRDSPGLVWVLPPWSPLEGGGANYMQVLNYKYLAIFSTGVFCRNKSRKHQKKVR